MMQSVTKIRTILELSTADFEWTLEKWSRNSMMNSEMRSQELQLAEIGRSCFLKIVFNKQYTGYNYFTVDLETCSKLKSASVKAYALSTTNAKIALSYQQELEIKYNNKSYISRQYLLDEQYVKDDTLTLFCSVNYVQDFCEVNGNSRNYNGIVKTYSRPMIPSDFGSLYKNRELCDVTFFIDEEEIKAHIVILASTSTYFKAMFTHDNMKENIKREVNFNEDTDITVRNFKAFLECIYGCKTVAEFGEIASEILVLADKFGVKPLQESCESYLCDMLNQKNVAKLLLFAEKYNCLFLKDNALNYAKANINIVKESDEFDELCKFKGLIKQLL